MNLANILIGVVLIIVLILAISFMNKGNSPCGGNCSTCAMSEHCEKFEEPKTKKKDDKKKDA